MFYFWVLLYVAYSFLMLLTIYEKKPAHYLNKAFLLGLLSILFIYLAKEGL